MSYTDCWMMAGVWYDVLIGDAAWDCWYIRSEKKGARTLLPPLARQC